MASQLSTTGPNKALLRQTQGINTEASTPLKRSLQATASAPKTRPKPPAAEAADAVPSAQNKRAASAAAAPPKGHAGAGGSGVPNQAAAKKQRTGGANIRAPAAAPPAVPTAVPPVAAYEPAAATTAAAARKPAAAAPVAAVAAASAARPQSLFTTEPVFNGDDADIESSLLACLVSASCDDTGACLHYDHADVYKVFKVCCSIKDTARRHAWQQKLLGGFMPDVPPAERCEFMPRVELDGKEDPLGDEALRLVCLIERLTHQRARLHKAAVEFSRLLSTLPCCEVRFRVAKGQHGLLYVTAVCVTGESPCLRLNQDMEVLLASKAVVSVDEVEQPGGPYAFRLYSEGNNIILMEGFPSRQYTHFKRVKVNKHPTREHLYVIHLEPLEAGGANMRAAAAAPAGPAAAAPNAEPADVHAASSAAAAAVAAAPIPPTLLTTEPVFNGDDLDVKSSLLACLFMALSLGTDLGTEFIRHKNLDHGCLKTLFQGCRGIMDAARRHSWQQNMLSYFICAAMRVESFEVVLRVELNGREHTLGGQAERLFSFTEGTRMEVDWLHRSSLIAYCKQLGTELPSCAVRFRVAKGEHGKLYVTAMCVTESPRPKLKLKLGERARGVAEGSVAGAGVPEAGPSGELAQGAPVASRA